MKLLITNHFHNINLPLRPLIRKYACGFGKNYSTKSIAGEQSDSDGKQADFIEPRLNLWNKLKAEFDESLKTKSGGPIKIGLQYGQVYEGVSWQSTPYDIFRETNKNALKHAIVARVNNELWDLNRPLEKDCQVELLNFDNPLAKEVLWHSSAHVLGSALEIIYGCLLNSGPATKNGFFYDIYNNDKLITEKEFPIIDKQIKKILRHKIPFERIVVSKANLLELFSYNKLKTQIIKEKTGERGTIYRCGTLIDFCTGPHVQHTGVIKVLKLLNSNLWHAKDETKLDRITGIAFHRDEDFKQWALDQEAAGKRDHRKIGRNQNLFFFHESSPGSCFFQPKGAHIYNTLLNFIKNEYRKRGFQEVITPNILKSDLWKVSGHWDHYAENIFSFQTRDKDEFVLKPMNCPGHCLMFAHKIRSHRELPLRFADFGVLHRDEPTGGLTGLTRVRRFQQDDAHIFCKADQIRSEIDSCLKFLSHVYGTFGFEFSLVLSTRPDSYLGDLDIWNRAETALEMSLNKFGKPWKLNTGDGAFYGPKIDITITDALKRAHQCGTIQLDFLLPQRFKLTYDSENDVKDTPVMIHRAIFGSLERFIAILIEHFGGRLPFFISPNQIMVVPVASVFDEYAEEIRKKLHAANFQVDADLDSRLKMQKKVRNAQVEQYNFILVVGKDENNTNLVNVRTRDGTIHGQCDIDELIARLHKLSKEFRLNDNDF